MQDLTSPSGDLDPIERASADELRTLQLDRLRWTLRHAYTNVPHYRTAFDAAGVHPDDCKDLTDLAKFPLTSKADLRDNYPFGMFAVPREQVVRVHASSGTTGRATVVGYTRDDIEVWATVMARSIRAAGGRPGHVLHNAYGYGLFTGGLGAHYGAEKLGCTVVPVSGGMTERQVTLIRDFRPDVIMVTPSYMLAIVDEMERQGDDPAASSLRFGIFGAEPWTNEMRAEMERRLGLDATDIYGLSEVMGPGVAQECVETKDGLHIWEDHFYPEVIDPLTGEVRPDGEEGELVFTSLTKQAMPVIRYRTRDLTRLLPGTARTMRRMQKITGRTDDMIILRGVNLFPTQIEELIMRVPVLSPHFQLHLSRNGPMDQLAVHVERRTGAAEAEAAPAGDQLAAMVKNTIGVTVTAVVLEPDSIERSMGKMPHRGPPATLSPASPRGFGSVRQLGQLSGQVTQADRAEVQRGGVPPLEVEAGPLPGVLPGRQPAPLPQLVGDGLSRPAEVADHLGPDPVRFGPAPLAQDLARLGEGPPGAVGQRQVQVDADVDDHARGAQRRSAQHAEPGARLGKPAKLIGQALGVQGPALAVPADERGLGEPGEPA
jgi:phenylacetate-CoA ligase